MKCFICKKNIKKGKEKYYQMKAVCSNYCFSKLKNRIIGKKEDWLDQFLNEK